MSMSQATERSRLLTDTKPQYVFDTRVLRERQRRVKQFQCCLCVIFVSILITGLLATIAFSINESNNEVHNVTNSTNSETLLSLISKSWPLPDQTVSEKHCGNETEWREALEQGQRALNHKNKIAENVTEVPVDSPSYKHQKIFATSTKSLILADLGYAQEFARRYFKNNTSKICNKNYTSTLEYCNNKTNGCNEFHKFRTYDGSCNNLKHWQVFGVAFQPFRRALPPDYADGISKPRVAQDGKPLPSARTVALEVHRPYYKNDEKFSAVLAAFGQFLDHDITATALSKGINGTSISCCSEDHSIHPECFPVKLDPFDPERVYNLTCMEFVRSAPAPTCCLGFREQMNQVSAFIDGSAIYGTDVEKVMELRTMQGGELAMFITEDNRTLLPISKDLNDGCNRKEEYDKGRYCFITGDSRANENLHLTSIHLLWARQHNLLAKKMAALNSNWDDERIFQETRKIIGAQLQHITYNEFLPILLGPDLMEKLDLYPQISGYFTKYNNSIDPSIANSFAGAAFRFAHSIIPGLIKFLTQQSSSPEYVQLHKILLDPFRLYEPGELDKTLMGALDTTIQASDPYFTDELKEHLFQDDSDKKKILPGLDLVSLNIQRGRDHGLVGYNSWRKHCGLRRVSTFEQLQGDIDDDSLKNIQNVYRNVDDIDLYTGAVSEKPINGSFLGPTITCLLLDQFVRIKYGDRLWYENPNWFTLEQLNEIRKSTLTRIICDNSDFIDSVQPRVMEKIREDNEVIACKSLPEPIWDLWKESLPHIHMSEGGISVKTSTED